MVMATILLAAVTFSQLLETKTEAYESTMTTDSAVKVSVPIFSLSSDSMIERFRIGYALSSFFFG
jgi:hypothetical protein